MFAKQPANNDILLKANKDMFSVQGKPHPPLILTSLCEKLYKITSENKEFVTNGHLPF